jgi:hypothetical protein
MNTRLPIFTGFYNTIFDCDSKEENILHEHDLPFEAFEFDYEGYRKNVAEQSCEAVCGWLKENNFAQNLEFVEIDSPKEYNFRNDEIVCDITGVNYGKIKNYLNSNLIAFQEHLENYHKSCDGFHSFYDWTFEAWQRKTDDFTNLDYNELWSILQFIMTKEIDYSSAELWLHDDIDVYLDYTIIGVPYEQLEDSDKRTLLDNLMADIDITFGYARILAENIKESLLPHESFKEQLENCYISEGIISLEGNYNSELELIN